jgi:dCMP deaminase
MSASDLTKWDCRFIQVANTAAEWSKDPDKKVGAVLISPDKLKVCWGYNGFPPGIEDSDARLYNKEVKNSLTIHAEANCLLHATDTKGWTMYITAPCCTKCALLIIAAGVSKVVMPELDSSSRWFEEQKQALELFIESDTVDVVQF